MVWFKQYLAISFIICLIRICNGESNHFLLKVLHDIKTKTQQFINPCNDCNDILPNIVINNGHIVYSNNQTKLNLEDINIQNFQNFIGSEIDFLSFKQPDNYYLINLGVISNLWDISKFDNFTTILDNVKIKYNTLRGLFGFTISINANNNSYNSEYIRSNDSIIQILPYIKASVRDLKQYMIFKKMAYVPIGIKIDKIDEFSIINKVIDYFICDNIYIPDFYLIGNNSIYWGDNNRDNHNLTRKKNCKDIENLGINTSFTPYSPRSSRCDCIMTMLKCVVNPGTKNLAFINNNDLLDKICSIVYCGSIINDPVKGNYGVFSSCDNLQKYSIAFNLYYTFNNETESCCNFNQKAKLLKKKSSTIDYLKLSGFDGKQCNEEIKEDWNKYLIGVSKQIGETSEPKFENVYNYDIDFNLISNNGGNNKLQAFLTKVTYFSSIWILSFVIIFVF